MPRTQVRAGSTARTCLICCLNCCLEKEISRRPAWQADWAKIMKHTAVIVCGDFNAKSTSWDPHCTTNENHHFTEKLIRVDNLFRRNV